MAKSKKETWSGIEIEGFKLVPEPLAHGKFNVYKKTVTGKGESRDKVLAYGVRISRAIEIIAGEAHWEEKKTQTLHQYIEEHSKKVAQLFHDYDEKINTILFRQSEEIYKKRKKGK